MDNQKIKAAAVNFFQKEWHELSEIEKRVVQSVAEKKKISRDLNRTLNDERTFGERTADKVATFGGSWTFICIFGGILVVWVVLNSFIL